MSILPLLLLALQSDLDTPEKKEIAMKLVSSAENSSLDWKAQYAYIEYNVEGNAKENRGYTGGLIGFTSRTHDMLELVQYYARIAPGNGLAKFLPALEKVDGTPSMDGLGDPFVKAWKAAAQDPMFQRAQDHERDRVYFNPAVALAKKDGLHALGQFCYYDAAVMHGYQALQGIRAQALKRTAAPSTHGSEIAFLSAFLDERVIEMKKEQGHQNTSRVDTMQRKFLQERNLDLQAPLVWKVYGDTYRIER